MALTQMTDDVAIIAALADLPNATSGLTAAQFKAKFDIAAGLIKTYINSTLLAELAAVTDGDSGADNIGMTTITETGSAATVQAVIEALITRLKAVTDSASGADLIGMTAISETGANATVQSIVEALITRLKATTDSASGADLIGATEVATGSGTTTQAILEWLYTQIINVTLGQIVDGSLTNAKLATDIKVGSLAALTTTDKSSVVASINEHLASKSPHTVSACRVYNDAVQAVANNVLTTLAFNGEFYDNDTMHNNATNNSRITITTAGKYRVSANIEIEANATGYRNVGLFVNGSTFMGIATMVGSSAASAILNVSADYNLSAGDYIQVTVFQNSGSSLNVSASVSTNRYKCEFMASLISI